MSRESAISASSMICGFAADHNTPSVRQPSSSIASESYDHATIAQRCPYTTHFGVSSCGVHLLYKSRTNKPVQATNMSRRQTCPGVQSYCKDLLWQPGNRQSCRKATTSGNTTTQSAAHVLHHAGSFAHHNASSMNLFSAADRNTLSHKCQKTFEFHCSVTYL